METIKLDFDSKDISFMPRIKTVKEILELNINETRIQVHETNNGFHVRIRLREKVSDLELVLIQSLMGSDYKRECLNFKRVKSGIKNWNLLFNKKWSLITGKGLGEEKIREDLTKELKTLLSMQS